MGLSRLLFWGALIWVALVLWRSSRVPPQAPAVRVVKCIQCGVYVPESEARASGQGFICASH
jgi:hypothetical protein